MKMMMTAPKESEIMNVRYLTTKEFRQLAKKTCGYIKTPSVQCGHDERSGKYCAAKICRCIQEMQDVLNATNA